MEQIGAAIDDQVLAAVVRGAGDAMGVIDETGVILFANDYSCRMLGWPRHEIEGTNLASHVHPEDLGRSIEMVAASLDDAPDDPDRFSPPVMVRVRRSDGTYRFVAATGSVVSSPGEPVLLSILLRPADDLLALHRTLRSVADAQADHEVLATVADLLRCQEDRPLVAIAFVGPDGPQVVGDAVPAELCGAVPPLATTSPWTDAWAGTERRGGRDDLPDDLRAIAGAHGLHDWWALPIADDDGATVAVLTLWHESADRSMLVWGLNVQFMVDAASVAMRHLDARRRLEHAAAHDALTGLANRATLWTAVAELARGGDEPGGQAPSARPEVAVLYIDLDGFKPVNDHRGHTAGDAVLVEVGRRLLAAAGPGDVVARLGGDEFCIVRVGSDRAEATVLAERLLSAISAPLVVVEIGEPVVIGASIGVAVGPAGRAEHLVDAADEALYLAKSMGGRTIAHAPAG